MAYNTGNLRNSYEVAASFGSFGARYTFFTSEAPEVGANMSISVTTAGSTSLINPKTKSNLKIKPLNSSVFVAPAKEWGNVSAGILPTGGQNFVANMTVSAMTNDQKMWMPVNYGIDSFCISSHSGKTFQSGQAFNKNGIPSVWEHDISWDVRPTAYAKSKIGIVGLNKNSQMLFPRHANPRWFRRAGIQKVTDPKFGSRLFFVYTDLLSRFYVYPVNPPKEKIVQILNYSDYCVDDTVYKKWDFPWGSYADEPSVATFRKHSEQLVGLALADYNDNVFLGWLGYGGTNQVPGAYTDHAYDVFMGTESGYDPYKPICDNQYLWEFNFNATKATTIAFKKGTNPLSVKAIDGSSHYVHKFSNAFYLFSDTVQALMGTSALSTPVVMTGNTMEQVFDYYPVLLEISINITLTGANPTDFDVAFNVLKAQSTDATGIYYLASGYTHPKFDTARKVVGGDELSYACMKCYGELTDYENTETTYDTFYTKRADSLAINDCPEVFKSVPANMEFLKMLVEGTYNLTTIKDFLNNIPDYSAYLTQTVSGIVTLLKWWGSHFSRATYDLMTDANYKEYMRRFTVPTTMYYGDPPDPDKSFDFDFLSTVNGFPHLKDLFAYSIKNRTLSHFLSRAGSPAYYDSSTHWLTTSFKSAYASYTGLASPKDEHSAITALYVMWVMADLADAVFANRKNQVSGGPKNIDSMVYDYCQSTQVLSTPNKIVGLLCAWAALDDVLIQLDFPEIETKCIKSTISQTMFRNVSDVEWSTNGATYATWVDGFFDKLPKLHCQVIDGYLIYNIDMDIQSMTAGTDYTNYETGLKYYSLFSFDQTLNYNYYLAEHETFFKVGKKIHSFVAQMEIVVSDVVQDRYNLCLADYVAILNQDNMISTFPEIKYEAGDHTIFSTRFNCITTVTSDVLNTANVNLLATYYGTNLPETIMTINSDNEDTVARSTNCSIFGLFVKPNQNTHLNAISALDLASSSVSFYGCRAAKYYNNYSVGSALYVDGIEQLSHGCLSEDGSRASDGVVLGTYLSSATFSFLYRMLAYWHTLDDIPIVRPYLSTNLLFDKFSDTARTEVFSFYPSTEIGVIASLIMSHPAGSISAYSLPPYGFLEALKVDPDLAGGYTASYTIDYISALNPSYKPTGTVEKWINTTHKQVFNSAFKQGRDYSYYTDPAATDGYLGGFCTAAVWYGFELPNEYSTFAPNLAV